MATGIVSRGQLEATRPHADNQHVSTRSGRQVDNCHVSWCRRHEYPVLSEKLKLAAIDLKLENLIG
jgi:hypothetical protein